MDAKAKKILDQVEREQDALKSESVFERLADKVSYGMGTPLNIAVWVILVACWFLLFATHFLSSQSNVLPAWFTSNAFNFPLNTVTTLAELYIGFLVAAAANRNERASRQLADTQTKLLAALKSEEDEIIGDDQTMHHLLTENTRLTKEVKNQTDLLEEIHRHIIS